MSKPELEQEADAKTGSMNVLSLPLCLSFFDDYCDEWRVTRKQVENGQAGFGALYPLCGRFNFISSFSIP